MLRSNTKVPPQYKMKHRLTGAIIIVALAIVVISALLNEPANLVNIDTVKSTQPVLQKTEVPITVTQQTTSTSKGNRVLTTDQKSNSDSNSEQSSDVAASELPLSGSGWRVHAGTFAEIANADSAFEKLTDNGLKARRIQVPTINGTATRVWLGPYAKKETAEKISLKIKEITGKKGYVTEHSS